MNSLIDQTYKNHYNKPLFSLAQLFGWYDGPISGVAKLNESADFYFFETVAIDFATGLRIYRLMRVEPWTDNLKTFAHKSDLNLLIIEIEKYVRQFSGKIFLFKALHIDAPDYDLITNESPNLLAFENIEDIANQNDDETKKWFKYFL